MATTRSKKAAAADPLIGRRVRINDDATYPTNGRNHAWAGQEGTVLGLTPNGKQYQLDVGEGQGVESLPLDSFTVLPLETDAGTATPQAAPAMDTGELMMLDRNVIVRSRTNPRTHFDPDFLQELAVSIKLQGLGQPILVRPLPAERLGETFENRYPGDPLPTHEIIAGEQRWRACGIAGVKRIPVLCRHLDDVAVLQLQLVENLKRRDLHPMEEAEGYERLMSQANMRAEDIAERIGKSRSYVFDTLKLLDLSANSRKAFYDGRFPRSVATMIARHIEQHQADIITHACAADRDPWPVRQVQQYIHSNYMLKLSDAPFKPEDVTLLPSAGSCLSCPKRTGANPELFRDVPTADTCTDKACFALKREAHGERLKAEAAAKGQTVIVGKEALEILPNSWSQPQGYKKLDERQIIGGQMQSLRKALGKDCPTPVLVEDASTRQMVAMLPNNVVNKLLKAKGVGGNSSNTTKAPEKSKGEQEALKLYHETWRKQAVAAIMQATRKAADERATELPQHLLIALRICAKRECEYGEACAYQDEIAQMLEIADSAVAVDHALIDHIKEATSGQLETLTAVALCLDDLPFMGHFKNAEGTPTIDAFAQALGIDLAAIQEGVKTSMRQEAEALAATAINKAAQPKPARKTKTSKDQASADIAAALQAAEDGAEVGPGGLIG